MYVFSEGSIDQNKVLNSSSHLPDKVWDICPLLLVQINDAHMSISEELLYEVFSKFGTVYKIGISAVSDFRFLIKFRSPCCAVVAKSCLHRKRLVDNYEDYGEFDIKFLEVEEEECTEWVDNVEEVVNTTNECANIDIAEDDTNDYEEAVDASTRKESVDTSELSHFSVFKVDTQHMDREPELELGQPYESTNEGSRVVDTVDEDVNMRNKVVHMKEGHATVQADFLMIEGHQEDDDKENQHLGSLVPNKEHQVSRDYDPLADIEEVSTMKEVVNTILEYENIGEFHKRAENAVNTGRHDDSSYQVYKLQSGESVLLIQMDCIVFLQEGTVWSNFHVFNLGIFFPTKGGGMSQDLALLRDYNGFNGPGNLEVKVCLRGE